MLKVKPILVFIIASVALHWWILSLPVFKRIQVLERNTAKASSPTLVAYLDQAQPVIKPSEKEKTQAQTTGESNTEDQSKLIQQSAPPPPFLRGSPWSRRSVENRNFNPAAPIQRNPLVEIENIISEDIYIGESESIECRRITSSSPFSCQRSSNKFLSEKVANAINRKALETNLALPNCITFETLQKKWHAKACHS